MFRWMKVPTVLTTAASDKPEEYRRLSRAPGVIFSLNYSMLTGEHIRNLT